MAITKFRADGVRTLEVYWNGETLRLTHDAELHVTEDRDILTVFVYEPVLDQEVELAEIELDIEMSDMDETQSNLVYRMLDHYEGIHITQATQLETEFDRIVNQLRKSGIIE